MASERWKGIAELIGIAAIVASLVFVGLQMKQTEDVATLISQNPDVWLRG
jgi:hypothetical protein